MLTASTEPTLDTSWILVGKIGSSYSKKKHLLYNACTGLHVLKIGTGEQELPAAFGLHKMKTHIEYKEQVFWIYFSLLLKKFVFTTSTSY